jgi:hypothetical protein
MTKSARRLIPASWSRPFHVHRAPPRAAVAWLAGLVLLIGLGLAQGVQPPKPLAPKDKGDLAYYARVIDRVKHGQSYYVAASDEVRRLHGPLKPFLTVRLPTLAWAMAALPGEGARILAVRLLAALTLAAWCARLKLWRRPPLRAALEVLTLASGVAPALAAQAYLMHETWAGLLIALALALYRPMRWGPSVALALLAVLERELAAPFLLVMALFALHERRFKESTAWLASLAVFAFVLWRHALAVQAQLVPSDAASPGWLAAGGWPFVLHAASWNVFVLFDQRWIVLLFPLALLGLAAWRGGLGARVALTVFGYTVAFLVLGRRDNFYWGLVIAPIWPLGLLTAPRTLLRLVRQATRGWTARAAADGPIGLAANSAAE